MRRRFFCSRLHGEVELTEERERHIKEEHPELLPAHRDKLAEVLADPDVVRKSGRTDKGHLFSRWYTDIGRGRHIVVVVMSQTSRPVRHWIVTAYITRRLGRRGVEWRRS